MDPQAFLGHLQQRGLASSGAPNANENASLLSQQAPSGNFFTRNLPTIGAIALPTIAEFLSGGLATPEIPELAAAGEAGGAALTGVGELAARGGLSALQRIGLTSLGSIGGTAGRNVLTGQSAGNDLGQAAVSGATAGVIGEGLSGILGGIGGGVEKLLGRTAPQVASKAAQAEADVAAKELAPYLKLSPAIQQGGVGVQGIAQAADFGLLSDMSPGAVHTAANLVTKANGELSGQVMDAIDGKTVDLSNISNEVRQAMDNPLNVQTFGDSQSPGSVGHNMIGAINKQLDVLKSQSGGLLDNTAGGTDVFKLIQSTERGIANAADPSTKAVLTTYRDALMKALGDSGANQEIANYSLPAAEAAHIKQTVLDEGGTPVLADHIISSIDNAKNISDLRNAQAEFVQMDHIAQAADQLAKGRGFVNEVTGRAGGIPAEDGAVPNTPFNSYRAGGDVYRGSRMAMLAATHPAIGIPGVAALAGVRALGSDAGKAALGNVVDKISPFNLTNVIPGGTAGLLARLAGTSIAGVGSQPAATTSNGQNISDLGQASGAGTTAGVDQAQAQTSQYPLQNMLQDIQNNPKQASTFMSLYKLLNPTLTSNEAKTVDNGLQATQALDQLEQTLQQGGAEGAGGLTTHLPLLGGAVNPKGTNLDNASKATAGTISQALGGTASPAEQKALLGLLPNSSDSPQMAQAKIDALRQRLVTIMNTTQAYPLNQSDLNNVGTTP